MNPIRETLLNSFRPPAFPGSYFLSMEGIEGSGKSTQLTRVKEHLELKNFRVLILREPGGTIFGEKLRQAVLQTQTTLHPVAEAHLFAASRAQLLHEVTMKELSVPNTVIICDRYLDSSLVYQGKARGLGYETILEFHNSFPLTLVPHLTFLLKIDLQTSHERQKIRNAPKDYFENQGDSFYEKLIEGYEEVEQMFPDRIVSIDASRSVDEVSGDILDQLDKLIMK